MRPEVHDAMIAITKTGAAPPSPGPRSWHTSGAFYYHEGVCVWPARSRVVSAARSGSPKTHRTTDTLRCPVEGALHKQNEAIVDLRHVSRPVGGSSSQYAHSEEHDGHGAWAEQKSRRGLLVWTSSLSFVYAQA